MPPISRVLPALSQLPRKIPSSQKKLAAKDPIKNDFVDLLRSFDNGLKREYPDSQNTSLDDLTTGLEFNMEAPSKEVMRSFNNSFLKKFLDEIGANYNLNGHSGRRLDGIEYTKDDKERSVQNMSWALSLSFACFANSFFRHVSNNVALKMASGENVKSVTRAVLNNPKSIYGGFSNRIGYNLFAITGSVYISKLAQRGKDIEDMTVFEKLLPIGAGAFSEFMIGSVFEMLSFRDTYLGSKRWGEFVRGLNDKDFKELFPTKTRSDAIRESFSAELLPKYEKYGYNKIDVKLNYKDFEAIFKVSSLPYFVRNLPFPAAVYLGAGSGDDKSVAKKLGLVSVLGFSSAFPALVGDKASILAARGFSPKEALICGFKDSVGQVIESPTQFGVMAGSRIFAGLMAVLVFSKDSREATTSFIDNLIRKALGVDHEFSKEDAKGIDEAVDEFVKENDLGFSDKPSKTPKDANVDRKQNATERD